jgi:hypothetical protein
MPLFDTKDVQAALRKAASAAGQDRPFFITNFGAPLRSSGLGSKKEHERDQS